ncbi:MAG TPA: helix-turn-helix transcriptional regulator [Burkholderiaceae bacterium]|nr:helix-turn-helix transcriptional regulator [Burkholderiaceae bacterium]
MDMNIDPPVGERVKALRQARRLSQLELSLRVGVSQRHLSFIETGRSQPSREMLLALMDALELPLAERNQLLIKAGFAPHYPQQPLASPDMAAVREALEQLLEAHDPCPAMVLDSRWNILLTNRGLAKLLQLLSGRDLLAEAQAAGRTLNVLDMLLDPNGLQRCFLNRDEILSLIHRRVWREVLHEPELEPRLAAFERLGITRRSPAQAYPPPTPVVTSRLQVPGTSHPLAFFSMFTTFGTPHDITAASLKVEHLFPADGATRQFVQAWL